MDPQLPDQSITSPTNDATFLGPIVPNSNQTTTNDVSNNSNDNTQQKAVPMIKSDTQSETERYSIGQAAQYLNVSIDTIRRWEKKGLIRAVRTAGNLRRFTKRELENCRLEQQNQDVLLPISEAAKELSVSIQTLRRWDKSEKFKAQRDGQGQRLYPRKELRQFLDTHPFIPEQNQPKLPELPKPKELDTVNPAALLPDHAQASEKTDTKPNVIVDAGLSPDEAKSDDIVKTKEDQPSVPIESENQDNPAQSFQSADDLRQVKQTITNDLHQTIQTSLDKAEQRLRENYIRLEKQIAAIEEQLRSKVTDDRSEDPMIVTKMQDQIRTLQSRVNTIANGVNEQNANKPYASLDKIQVNSHNSVINTTAAEFDPQGNLVRPQVEDHGTDSIGSATMPKGSGKMVIKTRAVTKNSLIFVSLATPCVSSLSVPIAINGEGFAVTIATVQNRDITYNWCIIEPQL